MLDHSILLFIFTSVLIILSPGQDMVLVLSRSLSLGPKAGMITAVGVGTGLLGHTALAAAGLGAVLQASEQAFTLMKILGAAYLIYLGIKVFSALPLELKSQASEQRSSWLCFRQGALSNISNPKIAIFYFAYLPQFVGAGSAQPTVELLLLGALFALLTVVVKLPIGYMAGRLSGWVQTRPSVQRWLNRISGGLLVAMGLRLAADSQQNI